MAEEANEVTEKYVARYHVAGRPTFTSRDLSMVLDSLRVNFEARGPGFAATLESVPDDSEASEESTDEPR